MLAWLDGSSGSNSTIGVRQGCVVVRIDRMRDTLVAQDVALDRGLVAGLGQPEKADAAQAGEIVVDVERAEEGLELATRNLAVAGVEQRLRRAQQRQMQVDAALDAVERIIGRRLEFDARRLLRGEIGKARHRQADQRDGDEGDDREKLLQRMLRCPWQFGPFMGKSPRQHNGAAKPS